MDTAIIEKIRKLHALAERAGTAAEAANAAARVQELLAKHNLALGEVLLKTDPGANKGVGKWWVRLPGHAVVLARACEALFDVRHYLYAPEGCHYCRFHFLGLTANVETACLTYEYLLASIDELAQVAKKQNIISGADEFRRFRFGAAVRIRDIAAQSKRRTVDETPGYGQLVHVSDSFAQQLFGKLKMDGRSITIQRVEPKGAAYNHGYVQGGNIDLSGGREMLG